MFHQGLLLTHLASLQLVSVVQCLMRSTIQPEYDLSSCPPSSFFGSFGRPIRQRTASPLKDELKTEHVSLTRSTALLERCEYFVGGGGGGGLRERGWIDPVPFFGVVPVVAGRRDVGRDVVEEVFEEEWGLFNLLIYFTGCKFVFWKCLRLAGQVVASSLRARRLKGNEAKENIPHSSFFSSNPLPTSTRPPNSSRRYDAATRQARTKFRLHTWSTTGSPR